MRFTHFHIKNFKGIEDIRLNLAARPQGKVLTLVGLNESGKTTILEALNFLSYKSDTLDPLNLQGYLVKDVHDLIPISKRANFNGSIVIEAGYEVTQAEEAEIASKVKKRLSIQLTRHIKSFTIKQSYQFENSTHVVASKSNRWEIDLWGQSKGAKQERKINGDAGQKITQIISEMLPGILFFPNFLFEFPDKIYLEGESKDVEKHQFYRTILQDVLNSTGQGINLKTHVLDRAKEGGPYSRRALESVLLNMGAHISRMVFQNWDRIFKRKLGSKEVQVSLGREEEEDRWYLQLRIRDENEVYAISERSLGFRWFFAFLLLTHYRGFRQGSTNDILFLLDEPASNLHSSAQSQLLESFGKLPGNSSVIYTTHSHHLIKPEWLEGVYVVKNEGIDYQSEQDDFTARNTRITLTKYREFAAKHPNQATYFQPILDVLDYQPGRLENGPNVVMPEGKNDFYALKYFADKIIKGFKKLHIMPGGGSGGFDDVIRLYAAWGRSFVILLDADREGKAQKQRYLELFGQVIEGAVFTLEDIDAAWAGFEMENLIPEAERMLIQTAAYPDATEYNKTHFNRAIQELHLTNKVVPVSDETKANFKKILSFCDKVLAG